MLFIIYLMSQERHDASNHFLNNFVRLKEKISTGRSLVIGIHRWHVILTLGSCKWGKSFPVQTSSHAGSGALQWRHNERDGASNHQSYDRLLNNSFRRRSKKTSKLRVTGLCDGNSPVTGDFPAQRASNVENVSIWWRHHGTVVLYSMFVVDRFVYLRKDDSREHIFNILNSLLVFLTTRKGYPFNHRPMDPSVYEFS